MAKSLTNIDTLKHPFFKMGAFLGCCRRELTGWVDLAKSGVNLLNVYAVVFGDDGN